jgi:hypothetical protein
MPVVERELKGLYDLWHLPPQGRHPLLLYDIYDWLASSRE